MATLPYFVFSPNTILSLTGLMRGPDPTTPTPIEDWRLAKVDVIIPALNEAENIVLCLASVAQQTLRPRRVVLVDDGSTDETIERARRFCNQVGIELMAIQRRSPIGKTPTIKRQARELDSDVEFILDADTVLESSNYIERTVQELYQAVGIASAFGTILPQRTQDRRRIADSPEVQSFVDAYPSARPEISSGTVRDVARGITNLYREVLYLFLQRFVYRGQMAFFGTTTNPVGCAVAYRRKYVEALFDYISPILGDDLTNSEDIFIGFSMLNEGYRNIQLADVYARTVEPEVQRLPRQIYFWSSAFLQSCYYFDPLVRSPFKLFRRWRARHRWTAAAASSRTAPEATTRGAVVSPVKYSEIRVPALAGATGGSPAGAMISFSGAALSKPMHDRGVQTVSASAATSSRGSDRRVVREPYRQAFGRSRTERLGRPAGWIVAMSAVEKVFFPTVMLIMAILHNWFGLALTIAIETGMCVVALALVMKGQRLQYALKALAVTPIRYALLGSELVTIGRFASDLWLTNNRKWRK